MESYKFVIPDRLPSNNEWIDANRRNWFVGNRMKQTAQNLVRLEIRKQLKGIHISAPVMLSYKYYEPNRKRDKDNVHAFAAKIIQDALVKEEVLVNDGWRDIFGFEAVFECDKEHPRIEVTITPFPEVMRHGE